MVGIIVDTTQVVQKFNRLKAELPKMLRDALKLSCESLREQVQANIEYADNPPFRDWTIAYHQKQFHPDPHVGLLDKYFNNYGESLHASFNVGNQNNILIDVGQFRVRYGTEVDYAELQERGGVNQDGYDVPPRPYLEPALNDPQTQALMVADMAQSFEDDLRKL